MLSDPGQPDLAEFPFDANGDDALFRELRDAASPPGRPELPGYFGVEEVARGGQGTVYQAWTKPGGVHVALKRVRGGRWASGEERERFLREVRLIRRLQHPGIVRVLALEYVAGGPVIVTEWVAGMRMDRWAELGPWCVSTRMRVLIRLCDAVGHAHRCGVVHRDLKPANVMVDDACQPRVLDFGIAQRASGEDGIGRSDSSGTPGYAAPEQSDPSAHCNPALDVYALGRLVSELVPLSLRSWRLNDIIAKAVAHDPRDRYRDADELGAALSQR